MEKNKMQNAIEEIRNITMTANEKKLILENILDNQKSIKQVKSPWSFYSFSLLFTQTKLAYYIVIPLIFILSGVGVVSASEDSLPDSVLYPIKVNIVEPIEGVLSFSNKAKAKHESKLAEKRLMEAETLANNGNLNTTYEKKINKLLLKHTEAFDNAINKDNDSDFKNDTLAIDAITTDFRAQMNAHARVLDILVNNKDEIKNKDKNNEISNTARVGAVKIKDNYYKNSNKIKKFKDKKEEVASLIENTGQEVNTSLSVDITNNPVIENTNNTIDQAKAYLYDAYKKDQEGKSEEAYSSLLDSETSIKEAKILLQEKDKINKNNDMKNIKLKGKKLDI